MPNLKKLRLVFLKKNLAPYIREPKDIGKAILGLYDGTTFYRAIPELKLNKSIIRRLIKWKRESASFADFEEKLNELLPRPPRFQLIPLTTKGEPFKRRDQTGKIVQVGLLDNDRGVVNILQAPPVKKDGKVNWSTKIKYTPNKFKSFNKYLKRSQSSKFHMPFGARGKLAILDFRRKRAVALYDEDGQFLKWLTKMLAKLERQEVPLFDKELIELPLNIASGVFPLEGNTIKESLSTVIFKMSMVDFRDKIEKGYRFFVDYKGEFSAMGERIKFIGSTDTYTNFLTLRQNLSKEIVQNIAKVGYRFTNLITIEKYEIDPERRYNIMPTKMTPATREAFTNNELRRKSADFERLIEIPRSTFLQLKLKAVKVGRGPKKKTKKKTKKK